MRRIEKSLRTTAVSDKYGERFHQNIALVETRYKEKSNANMMGDYSWFLQKQNIIALQSVSKDNKLGIVL